MTRYNSVKAKSTEPGQSYADCLRFYSGQPDMPGQKESRLIPTLFSLLLSTALSFLMIASPAQAGDEEFNPSAYQIFDPTTGYFIDVEPPPDEQAAAGTQNHAASTTDPASITNQAGQQAAVSESVAATAESGTAPPNTTSANLPLLIGAGLLILLAVFAFLKRKGEHR
jgi:LPXTG-motif cell wall-anchored protein